MADDPLLQLLGQGAGGPTPPLDAPQTPDVSSLPPTTAQVPQAPTPRTPVQGEAQRSGYQGPRPILMDLIQGLISPRTTPGMIDTTGAQGPNRPVSRAATFEEFLGNFVGALGQGFAAAGHGPGSGMRGAGAAIGAPLQMQQQRAQFAQQQQLEQAQAQEAASRASLTQAQAQPVTVPGIEGQIPAGSIPALMGRQLAAQTTGEFGLQKQQLANQNRLSIEQLKLQAATGQLARIETQQDGSRLAINKYGKPLGVIDGAIDPRMLANVSDTVDFQTDAAGNIVALPKRTVSGKQRPATPSAPGTIGGPARFPQPSQPATGGSRIPKPSTATTPPTSGIGKVVMQGKTSADVGVAYDQRANEYVQTTRAEAAQNGLQQFNKITAKEQDENRQFNNRITDVATKLGRYDDAVSSGLSIADKSAIASVLESDKFKMGAFGSEIPVDIINQVADALHITNMSDNAKRTLAAYYNARESMVGYQRVLSGSGRSNEKAMQMNLDALPSPIQDQKYLRQGLDQFYENIKIAGQGLPRMKGIQNANDVLRDREPVRVQIPGQAEGTVRRGRLKDFQAKYPSALVKQ